MPIVQEGEERPKRSRHHRWWLAILALPLVLLLGVVACSFIWPLQLSAGGQHLVVWGSAAGRDLRPWRDYSRDPRDGAHFFQGGVGLFNYYVWWNNRPPRP